MKYSLRIDVGVVGGSAHCSYELSGIDSDRLSNFLSDFEDAISNSFDDILEDMNNEG